MFLSFQLWEKKKQGSSFHSIGFAGVTKEIGAVSRIHSPTTKISFNS